MGNTLSFLLPGVQRYSRMGRRRTKLNEEILLGVERFPPASISARCFHKQKVALKGFDSNPSLHELQRGWQRVWVPVWLWLNTFAGAKLGNASPSFPVTCFPEKSTSRSVSLRSAPAPYSCSLQNPGVLRLHTFPHRHPWQGKAGIRADPTTVMQPT